MRFRPISLDGFERPPAADVGVRPVLQWIPIADLVVDEAFQRRISREGRKAIRSIAASFDWMFFSPVIVAPAEDKKFAVIDGQHRTTAAMLVGIREVPCQLVLADPRQQAAAFAAINGKVQRASTMQIFHAAKAAGEGWAEEVDRVATAAGVTVLRYPIGASVPDRPPHSTMAVVVLRRMIAKHGANLTGLMLRCITRSQLGEDPGALGQLWMGAIATVLAERPQVGTDEGRLIAFFDGLDAGATVKAAQAEKGQGVSLTESLATRLRALLDVQFREAAA